MRSKDLRSFSGAAPGGAVAEEIVRLREPSGVPLRGANLDGGGNAAPAGRNALEFLSRSPKCNNRRLPNSLNPADPGGAIPTAASAIPRFDDPCGMFHFWSPHSGGANFALADGSVRFIGYSVNGVMPALASRAGGEVASVPE